MIKDTKRYTRNEGERAKEINHGNSKQFIGKSISCTLLISIWHLLSISNYLTKRELGLQNELHLNQPFVSWNIQLPLLVWMDRKWDLIGVQFII